MTVVPQIVAHNLRLIGGGDIVAIADLVVHWRAALRRCLWRRQREREGVELPCDCIHFWNHGDACRFREITLAAMRELAEKMREPPAPQLRQSTTDTYPQIHLEHWTYAYCNA
jgi:hypothetical protein